MNMEEEQSYIEGLVGEIKAELFSPSAGLCSLLLPPSAYDTAWVAMVPDPQHPERPMFAECIDWILKNQWQSPEGGFWGSTIYPTTQCLVDTLACIVALDKWNVGALKIEQGLLFVSSNLEKLLISSRLDYGFAITLAGMIELAQTRGLQVLPPDGYKDTVNNLFRQRDQILQTMERSESNYISLELYREALPANYMTQLRGKLDMSTNFTSPSAAASVFMTTGDNNCKDYLRFVVQRCRDGAVPPMYPCDEDLIKLSLVDHLERLGCGNHFEAEISDFLKDAYRNWMEEQPDLRNKDLRLHIYQNSLTFRLLRSHGYNVSPGRLCWFVHNEELLSHIEKEYNHYLGPMYELYRASHLMFSKEGSLEKAKHFSRKLLQKSLLCDIWTNEVDMLDGIQIEIDQELKLPWLSRMDHLEHRRYIEHNRGYGLWLGKTSLYRLSFPESVNELAKRNFMLRQSVYRTELEELKRWSKDTCLSDMGFGREKTTYCYFLSVVSICLPLKSNLRKILAKCGILVTIVDDFFDEKGSLDELRSLTEAIQRWEGKALSGHAKVIFDALNEHIIDVASEILNRQNRAMEMNLQEMWREIFESWLKESIWRISGHTPSIEEYLKVGMISIAIHALTIPYCYLASLENRDYSKITHYNDITRLLMLSTRLLNDIQSYQKEAKDGKLNMVLLYLKENEESNIEGSINYIINILNTSQKLLLELILRDDYNIIPKEWKGVHLSLLKVFHMLYNDGNRFDSPTTLLCDINNAIYNPLEVKDPNSLTQEIPKYTLMKKHTSQPKGNASNNVVLIPAKMKHGFKCALYCDTRLMETGIKRSLNWIGLRRFPILQYQASSMVSAKALSTSRSLSLARVHLLM